MKKTFLFLLFIVFISPAFAQTVKFGISGGLNEAMLDYKGELAKQTWLAGFNAGIFSDIDFGKLSIEPGLFYTTKGQKLTSIMYLVTPSIYPGGGGLTGHGSVNYNYLELPVNIFYNIPVSYGKFFIGGGPYLAYGLSAKSKIITTATSNGTSTTTESDMSLSFGSDNDDLKRFDFGLGARGGLALKNGLSLSVGYEHGLTSVAQDGSTYKNEVMSVSLGYSFR